MFYCGLCHLGFSHCNNQRSISAASYLRLSGLLFSCSLAFSVTVCHKLSGNIAPWVRVFFLTRKTSLCYLCGFWSFLNIRTPKTLTGHPCVNCEMALLTLSLLILNFLNVSFHITRNVLRLLTTPLSKLLTFSFKSEQSQANYFFLPGHSMMTKLSSYILCGFTFILSFNFHPGICCASSSSF